MTPATKVLTPATPGELAMVRQRFSLVIFENVYYKNTAYPEPEYPPELVVIPKIYLFASEAELVTATRAAKLQGKTCVALQCSVVHVDDGPDRITFQ